MINLLSFAPWLGLVVWTASAASPTPDAPGHPSRLDGSVAAALDSYDIQWSSPSTNCAGSMPVGGGDIGCNVWVENGELLAYFQRSGSFSDIGEYLKLGRLRVKVSPNPFADAESFRQELKLREGYVEIEARGRGGAAFAVKARLWVEVDRPVIHLDIEAAEPIQVTAGYENWRLEDRELKDGHYGERFGTFTLEGYPGKVIKLKDQVGFEGNSVLFYHRNPAPSLLPGLLIEQQGLEAHAKDIPDPLSNLTLGAFSAARGSCPPAPGMGSTSQRPSARGR